MKRALERIEIPGEHGARERTWVVARAAFDQRVPDVRRHSWRPVALLAAAVAVLAGLFSPPGRAVLDDIRQAVGVEKAEPALFSLPAAGRLLVTAGSGTWVVERDGSRRHLGPYQDAAWSPFGRFVAAARTNELVALTPGGETRWSLARPAARSPAWSGTRTDTRIAFVTDSRLHVVGGDGTRDVDAGGGPAPRAVTPAWRPRRTFELSYVDVRGRVRTFAVDGPGTSWTSTPIPDARRLAWAPDGTRLAVVGRDRLVLLRGSDGRPRVIRVTGLRDAAYAPDGRLALLRTVRGRSELLVDGVVRFSTLGSSSGLTWAPDGSWILAALPEADQWIFVRTRGRQGILAVANVSGQFRSRTSPTIAGWCCSP